MPDQTRLTRSYYSNLWTSSTATNFPVCYLVPRVVERLSRWLFCTSAITTGCSVLSGFNWKNSAGKLTNAEQVENGRLKFLIRMAGRHSGVQKLIGFGSCPLLRCCLSMMPGYVLQLTRLVRYATSYSVSEHHRSQHSLHRTSARKSSKEFMTVVSFPDYARERLSISEGKIDV